MRRLRNSLALLVAFVALGSGVIGGFARSAQAVTPVTICDQSNSSWCWITSLGLGQHLYEQQNVGYLFDVESVAACGGGSVVTSNCPFTSTALDKALLGKPIVKFVLNDGSGYCMDADSGGTFNNNDCNGAHAWYVLATSNIAAVNVQASNWENGIPEYVAGNQTISTPLEWLPQGASGWNYHWTHM